MKKLILLLIFLIVLQGVNADYKAYCDTASATKWWIVGEGSAVNRLSEVIDDNPLGVEEADNPGNYQPWSTFINEISADSFYQIKLLLEIGNGTTTTTLTSIQETVYFDDGAYFVVKDAASLTLGRQKSSLYSVEGSFWSISLPSSAYTRIVDYGDFYMFASSLQNRGDGWATIYYFDHCHIRDSLISNLGTNPYWRAISFGYGSDLILDNVYFSDLNSVGLNMDGTYNDIQLVNSGNGFTSGVYYLTATFTNIDVKDFGSFAFKSTPPAGWQHITFLDPKILLTSSDISLGYSTTYLYEKFTFNPQIQDKDGNALENANVTAYWNNGSIIFSEITNSSGYISEQEILTRYFKGTDETETVLNPINITIDMDNYQIYQSSFNITQPFEDPIIIKDYPIIINGYLLFNNENVEIMSC